MKKIGFLFIVLACWAEAGMAEDSRAEQLRAELMRPETEHVFVAAHRADWRNYPENSVEAMNSAIKMGVDILEIDLQLTADSQLIIMHDATLDRTTTGKGRIRNWSLDSIRTLYLRSGHGEPSRYRVPTLREALVACKGKVLINLDKADRYFDLVVPLLEETGTTRQIIMKGSKSAEEVQARFGEYLNDVIYMPVVHLRDDADLDKVAAFRQTLHPVAYEFCFRTDTTLVREASAMVRKDGLVWINTLWPSLCAGLDDDSHRHLDSTYGFLIDTLHARVLQTDRPQALINYLHQRDPKQLYRDWANYGRYAAVNDSIVRGLNERPMAVLMGNSITQHWVETHPAFFREHNFAGRGISGQSSAQMLARFRADVIDLHPRIVVILAGTNDLACNNGYVSNEHIMQQIISMCELAKANKIRPVLCSILPSSRFYWRPAVGNPTERILAVNQLIEKYAKTAHIPYVNYYDAMVTPDGSIHSDYSADGVHPNKTGYAVMEDILLKKLTEK